MRQVIYLCLRTSFPLPFVLCVCFQKKKKEEEEEAIGHFFL